MRQIQLLQAAAEYCRYRSVEQAPGHVKLLQVRELRKQRHRCVASGAAPQDEAFKVAEVWKGCLQLSI
jgi:hypothetical protein